MDLGQQEDKKTAVLWPYRFGNRWRLSSWEKRMIWVTKGLQKLGYDVLVHPGLKVIIPGSKPYKKESECDIVIYNHADISEIRGDVIKAKKTWFFKPTVPDKNQTTLDELGYGSYSSPTYNKPDFENISQDKVDNFFDTVVKKWIKQNPSKWGNNHFKQSDYEYDNYYLVLGQVFNDSVLTRQNWGSYTTTLISIIRELNVWTQDKIVVKLHPYTNGIKYKKGKDFDYAADFEKQIKSINSNIEVISDFTSVHSLLEKAKAVIVGNSGSGFEAMMYRKPIISFAFPEYHWVTYDLRKICDVHNALKVGNWFNSNLSDRYLYWYMREYCFYDEESAYCRVKSLLKPL